MKLSEEERRVEKRLKRLKKANKAKVKNNKLLKLQKPKSKRQYRTTYSVMIPRSQQNLLQHQNLKKMRKRRKKNQLQNPSLFLM